jgi:hypothetical protein
MVVPTGLALLLTHGFPGNIPTCIMMSNNKIFVPKIITGFQKAKFNFKWTLNFVMR